MDLVYLGIALVFLVGTFGLLRLCESVRGES